MLNEKILMPKIYSIEDVRKILREYSEQLEKKYLLDLDNKREEILQDYFFHKCSSCPEGGHSSFWRTVIMSDEWQKWKKFAWEDHMLYDFSECEELGIISSKHFQDFISFTIKESWLKELAKDK